MRLEKNMIPVTLAIVWSVSVMLLVFCMFVAYVWLFLQKYLYLYENGY